MRNLKILAVLPVLGIFLLAAPSAHAQRVVVGVGVGAPVYVGPPPVCAYGYYPDYPYACAPYGYYGPDWFVGGVFIGAGPWFGYYGRPHGFYGRPYYRGYYGRPFYGRPGFAHGPVVRGPGFGRGPAVHSFHGGGFHGGGGGHGHGRR